MLLVKWIDYMIGLGGTISNTSYRLITMNEMMNTHTIDQIGYNAYVFDDIGNMRINKRF